MNSFFLLHYDQKKRKDDVASPPTGMWPLYASRLKVNDVLSDDITKPKERENATNKKEETAIYLTGSRTGLASRGSYR